MKNKKGLVGLLVVLAVIVLVVGGIFLFRGNSEINDVVEKTTGEVKEFNMIAKQWEFIPGNITVNQGDIVRLSIKSTDVEHGFAISEFNVNEKLEPNKETIVEFVASKKGEFSFFCSVFCGSDHRSMKGILIVN